MTMPAYYEAHLDDVFTFVRDYCATHDCSPNLREIAAALDISLLRALRCLDALRDAGRLNMEVEPTLTIHVQSLAAA